ncbi:MAG: VWA domain-containing protein [Nanoarchaeota archaeon]|nr:VWA domain-containing protein [Nanoarchaeota archaeon]
MKNKRAVFFSTDALIALTIIFFIILIAFPIVRQSQYTTELHSDVLATLSSLKIGEINNPVVQSLISQGKITDLDKSVLEQIGEFYVTNITLARSLADAVLSDLKTNLNIGLWYGNLPIYLKNSTPYETAQNIEITRQIISGIGGTGNASATGFAARAFLTSSQQNKYAYFGGYVGDGNITVRIEYNGNITSAKMELTINNDFELYINNNFISTYQSSPDDFTPVTYTINETDLAHFSSGINLVELKGDNLHIAGGFIKITYQSNVQFAQPTKYSFPGIDGIINLYDGFYIPGQLQTMDISLHLNSSFITFLTIGNTTVFRNATSGEQTITLSNSELSSLLTYSELSQKTIPLRLGMENVSFITNATEADVFSVADISGSKNANTNVSKPGGGTYKIIELIVLANQDFAEILLNISSNRLGLAPFKKTVPDELYHELSNDKESLNASIASWDGNTGGPTCICCGINKAITGMQENSTAEKSQSMVVSSDGGANERCNEPNANNAEEDAIQAACNAYNNYNITVHAVGFGSNVDEITLQAIAACGNGTYYFADISQLAQLYREIARNIIQATYSRQTINVTGNITTKLYSDSYIQFNYTPIPVPHGLIITSEKQFDNEYSGSFSLPEGSAILETIAISYSGPRWTDYVEANNIEVYKLSDYGQEYIKLGDPHAINIPNSLIQENNNIIITTGISPENSTFGSLSNKIIYTIAKNVSGFSPISASANGCIWHIQFEDDTEIEVGVPSGSEDHCYYNITLPDGSSTPSGGRVANGNDAFQIAVRNLLRELDLDSPWNNKVDIKFTEQDFQISLTQLTGIPFVWSTKVEARIWN